MREGRGRLADGAGIGYAMLRRGGRGSGDCQRLVGAARKFSDFLESVGKEREPGVAVKRVEIQTFSSRTVSSSSVMKSEM